MDIQTVLIIGMAGAFIVSAIDYWTDLGFWRPVIAFLFAAVASVLYAEPQDFRTFLTTLLIALACAFATMALIKIVERMNLIQTRLR